MIRTKIVIGQILILNIKNVLVINAILIIAILMNRYKLVQQGLFESRDIRRVGSDPDAAATRNPVSRGFAGRSDLVSR